MRCCPCGNRSWRRCIDSGILQAVPPPPDFIQWVTDPARTNDELFTVEILVEGVRAFNWPFNHVDNTFAGQRERARERKLNPAHRPALHPDELQELIGRRDTIKNFSGA